MKNVVLVILIKLFIVVWDIFVDRNRYVWFNLNKVSNVMRYLKFEGFMRVIVMGFLLDDLWDGMKVW